MLDIPGHTAGHIAYVGGGTAIRSPWSATRCSPPAAVACSRARRRRCRRRSGSSRRFPTATAVYCGHEYTLANLRFAQAVEPDNAALRDRDSREQGKRDRGVPTVPSTIADERATNPFLRCSEPDVVAAAQAHAGRPLDGPVETFAVLRAWKNDFR